MVIDNILQGIGKTPLVRFNKVTDHLKCQIFGKCEFLNPGGSVKDRIGYWMVERAEKEGRIKPGDTLIEPTSGNTGIGLALAGAVKGYNVIITMPEKMSQEKQAVLEALGATIYRTPTEVAYDHPDSHISVAIDLENKLPNAHILDQYSNPNNPHAHYEITAEELLDDMGTDIKMVVMGVGTGGTVSGVAKKLKEKIPDVIIVGVDPVGSILGGGECHPYQVEGIGYDFIPEVLDNNLIDRYVKVKDEDSFNAARRLIREEGLLVGGSSGTALHAAWEAARDLGPEDKCIVFLPDNIRNYLTKFVNDEWMKERGWLREEAVTC